MKIRIFHEGFNYSQDGPGNRLVVHLSGCNLHCPWCSNPEGIGINEGKEYDCEDYLAKIISCKRLFFDDGGVTFTGGECTLQSDALLYLLKECKKNNISTAIETNSTFSNENNLLDYVDYLFCDFKHYDSKILNKLCGGNDAYLKNLSNYIYTFKGKMLIIRTVLINHFNTSEEDLNNFVSFFKQFKNLNKVYFEFLPYHEYGKIKWLKLGKEYKMKDAFISEKCLDKFIKEYKKNGFKVVTL